MFTPESLGNRRAFGFQRYEALHNLTPSCQRLKSASDGRQSVKRLRLPDPLTFLDAVVQAMLNGGGEASCCWLLQSTVIKVAPVSTFLAQGCL